jgi:hypothetical protein
MTEIVSLGFAKMQSKTFYIFGEGGKQNNSHARKDRFKAAIRQQILLPACRTSSISIFVYY